MELQPKKSAKRLKQTGNLFRKNLQVSVNFRLKTIYIIGQRKHSQRILESKCARKETVDINILVTSRNGDRKIMQSIKITGRPPYAKREVEPVEPVRINIYQSNTYGKDLS